MANVQAMRRGLNTNLATITNLTTYESIRDKPEPPCALVLPAEPFAIPESMGSGIFTYRFRVLVLVSYVIDDVSQATLDGYLNSSGTGSVFAAVEVDKTLGGAASNATVEQISTYGNVDFDELRYWGAELLVRAIATG